MYINFILLDFFLYVLGGFCNNLDLKKKGIGSYFYITTDEWKYKYFIEYLSNSREKTGPGLLQCEYILCL